MFEVYTNDNAYFLYREGYGMLMVSKDTHTIKLAALGDFYLPTGQFLTKTGNCLYAWKTLIGKLDPTRTQWVNQLAENWNK